MATDNERREAAARLRGRQEAVGQDEDSPELTKWDDLTAIVLLPEQFRACMRFKNRDNRTQAIRSVIAGRLADLIEPQPVTGETSDGYHTFDELYDHRAKLFSVIVRCFKDRAWKSKLHHDGTMYEGMFIVGVETPQGQATYHYDVDPYWELFDCKELVRAPEWDGHTPEQAISRIASLRPSCDRDALLALADEIETVNCPDYGEWDTVVRRIREALGVES